MFSLETTSHLFHLNIIYNLCIEEIYKYTPVCFLPFYVGWSDHTFMHNHKYNSGSEEFTSVTRCNVNRVIWNWSKCHNVNVRWQLLVSYKTVSGWHPLVPSPLSHSPLIWLTNQSVSYVMWVNEPIKSVGDDVTMFSLETTSHLFHLNIIYNLCIEEIYKYTPVCFLPFYVGWSDHTFMHNHKYNSGSEEFTSVTRCNVNRVIWNWSKCHNVNVRRQLLVSYKTVSGWHPLVPSPLSHSPLIWLTNQSVSYVMWVNEPIKSIGDDVTMFSLETTSHLFHLNIIYNLCIEEIYKYTPVCFLPFYVGWSDHTFMHNHKYNSGSEEFTSVTCCNVNRVPYGTEASVTMWM